MEEHNGIRQVKPGIIQTLGHELAQFGRMRASCQKWKVLKETDAMYKLDRVFRPTFIPGALNFNPQNVNRTAIPLQINKQRFTRSIKIYLPRDIDSAFDITKCPSISRDFRFNFAHLRRLQFDSAQSVNLTFRDK